MKRFIFLIITGIFFCFAHTLKGSIPLDLSQGSANSAKINDLTGRWKFTANIEELGEISFLLNIQQTSDTSFVAVSRQNALKNVFGGFKNTMAKLFSDRYKKGAFVHINEGEIIEGDQQVKMLTGVFTAPMLKLFIKAQVKDGEIVGALVNNLKETNPKINYELTAVRHPSNRLDYNYINLVDVIKDTIASNVYNPSILENKDWKKFFNKLYKKTTKVHDDVEFFLTFSVLSQELNTSHVGILKYNAWESLTETETTEEKTKNTEKQAVFVDTKTLDSSTAYIQFDGFTLADTALIRTFFKEIINKEIPHLIMDMRGTSGGDFSSMYLASYLIDKPIDAGVFLGNKYFEKHDELPTDSILSSLPNFKGKSLQAFLKTVRETGILVGRVEPNKNLQYTGAVHVLTDQYSASATEPIVYFLKKHHLATLYGEKTAGKMLSSTVIPTIDNWHVIVPVADYYTADGFRIEQRGVEPHIKVKPEEALKHVKAVVAGE